MSFANYINSAEALCISEAANSTPASPNWLEFCRGKDGRFFFAKFSRFTKRSEAEIIFISEDEAKEFTRRFGSDMIYNYIFKS